jgi:hypothetical protein
MADRHGLAYFPGIEQVESGSLSHTVGISPSVATLTIAPQLNFTAQVGTLTFFDGVEQVEWKDARIDVNSFELNASGLVWRLSIYDRRWKWQSSGGGSSISLGANLRDDKGELIKATEMNPQDVAKKCLEAMGESDYDVSALPEVERPELLWDSELPAQCLESLSEMFGCCVVLGFDNKVRICKIGEGADLPSDLIMKDSESLRIPGMPKKLTAVCAPDLFQIDVALEPVGIENDRYGTLKSIYKLSYEPDGGWEDQDVMFMDGVEDEKDRELAKKSVFRYYRVQFPIYKIYGYTDSKGKEDAKITYPWQIRLENFQVETIQEDWGLPESQQRRKPPVVFGVYHKEQDGNDGNNHDEVIFPYTSDYDELEVKDYSWNLGSEASIGKANDHYVVFDRPIYKYEDGYYPADLILRIACTILDEHTFAPVRTTFDMDTGSELETEPRYEPFADLQVWHYYDLFFEKKVVDNKKEVKKDADYYLDGLMKQYAMTTPQTIDYAGMRCIELDGAIQHVSISFGPSGCTTTASRNNEQLNRTMPLSYRKFMANVKSNLRGVKQNKMTLRKHRHE